MQYQDQVGVVYHEIVSGGVTQEVFGNFLVSLTSILDNERAVLIMDNALAHHIQLDSEYQVIKYLPLYSPFLSPIENYFSVLKSDMKQQLNVVQEAGNRQAAREAGVSLVQWRENILKMEFTSAMDVITTSNYCKANCCLTDCIQAKDIFD